MEVNALVAAFLQQDGVSTDPKYLRHASFAGWYGSNFAQKGAQVKAPMVNH